MSEPQPSGQTPEPSGQGPEEKPEYTPEQARYSLMGRRRQKIIDEIERNRRGEYVVPTWVLAAALVVLVAGIAALIIFA